MTTSSSKKINFYFLYNVIASALANLKLKLYFNDCAEKNSRNRFLDYRGGIKDEQVIKGLSSCLREMGGCLIALG